MDPVKEAFQRIKEDISSLRDELDSFRKEISSLKEAKFPTIPTQNQTQDIPFSNNPTDNLFLESHSDTLKPLNFEVSTGNKGVPTNKPTNQQTVQQIDNSTEMTFQKEQNLSPFEEFHKVKEVLDSLDSMKKSIRTKFKRLTPQEMLIFSTIYSLEELGIEEISYKLIANNLHLSESSIRDYTNKLIKKGIPINKVRLNNKMVSLSISPELKELATLSTIIKLREI